MSFVDLELTHQQYAQFRSRGCPYLLQLAKQVGLEISPTQLEQDLLFLILACPTQPRIKYAFYSKLILIYYFHRLKHLPLGILFQRFHIATSSGNLHSFHNLCDLMNPTETRLTYRQAELKTLIEETYHQFLLSDDSLRLISRICQYHHLQHYLVRHLIAAAVLYVKPLVHLNEISVIDLATWAHCCTTTLTHIKHQFPVIPLCFYKVE